MPGTILPTKTPRTHEIDAPLDESKSIGKALRSKIRGEVRFDRGSRAMYSTDASNYRQLPVGVVIPREMEDVVQTLAVCREFGLPVLARGGGTSLAGQCCNAAVVLDFSKYLHHVLSVDPERRTARVQAGCVLDELRHAAERYNLTFGPDPATHSHNTLGGMIGNDSCGVHSVMAEFYGPGARTADQVEELEIVTYDGLRLTVGPTPEDELERIISEGGRRGEIYSKLRDLRDRYADLIRERFPNIPRRVSGYNLPQLLPENGFNVARALVGSESTCVTVLEAKLTLVPSPRSRSLLVLGYPSVFEAGDHIPRIREFKPIGCEGMDDLLVEDMKKKGIHPEDVQLLPPGRGWLMVEFGGNTKEESDARAHEAMDALRDEPNPPTMKLFDDPEEEHQLWIVRESGLGATARVPGEPDNWPGWEDSAVAPDQVGPYLREFRELLDRYGYEAALYGHFGQGCIHCRISFDLYTAEGIETWKHFLEDAADLVVRHGGSLSGEHGDGQARGWLLPRMFGDELVQAFREFRAIWDPEGRMNPGKIVDPYPVDSNLRIGPEYRPQQPETHFHFPRDDGSFARGVLRCVGVGECRREEGGTMCPSYMVTREEEHSTRGRSRLLFEMLQGEFLQDGWRDPHVKESLDLCLACKGCKGDCPMSVDMATYKAEFLSHYYEGRLRPRAAYSMGLIHWWARLAAHAPRLVNLASHTPLLRDAIKALGGVSLQREVPRFAEETFRDWFARRPQREGGMPVLLWPDTFTDHFHPEIGKAAVEVLEDAGYSVEIPTAGLCCGRPLYDFGMLDLATHQLRDILRALRPWIAAGVPLVGLEPSCVTVFRDEMGNLLPGDEDAHRLAAQTYLLSELLDAHTPGYAPPRMDRKAVVHGHCHHKAVIGMTAEANLLAKMGLDFEILDSGCCGMAGSFGFEAEHYDVSIAIGERVLLPAVRKASADTLIVADGFSCRQQIEQTTGRRALHLAEVLQMALHASGRTDAGALEEVEPAEDRKHRLSPYAIAATAVGGALLGTAVAHRMRGASPIRRHGTGRKSNLSGMAR
jgi:FAD/FMN-containing dehydrogenase/Fe-S oxidoreductase